MRILWSLILFLSHLVPVAAQQQVDLLLYNGKIFTADDMLSIHSAVAIQGDRIVAVGGPELLGGYRGHLAIDLQGRFVVPGFHDTHLHVWGAPRRHLDLSRLHSIQEIREAVRSKAAELGKGEWVTGDGWAEGLLAERRAPLRADLDEAAPENPVVLVRSGGHSAVANSRALELAGIDDHTPDPEGGILERDGQGRITGIIRERQDLLLRLVPPAPLEEVRPSFERRLRELLQLGITSLIHAGAGPAGYREWERLYRLHGPELPRATVQIAPGLGPARPKAEQALQVLKEFGKKTGDGDQYLKVGALKVWVGGGFAGPAAWTLEPYPGQPDYYGIQNVQEEELEKLVQSARDRGWQMGFHTVGDAAIQLAVDIFARVLQRSPRSHHRHYLNHFTVVPPLETLRKMALWNIAISQQANFTYSPTLESRYLENLSGQRLERNNPLRTPMSHSIFVALASDNHPIGPLVGIYGALT